MCFCKQKPLLARGRGPRCIPRQAPVFCGQPPVRPVSAATARADWKRGDLQLAFAQHRQDHPRAPDGGRAPPLHHPPGSPRRPAGRTDAGRAQRRPPMAGPGGTAGPQECPRDRQDHRRLAARAERAATARAGHGFRRAGDARAGVMARRDPPERGGRAQPARPYRHPRPRPGNGQAGGAAVGERRVPENPAVVGTGRQRRARGSGKPAAGHAAVPHAARGIETPPQRHRGPQRREDEREEENTPGVSAPASTVGLAFQIASGKRPRMRHPGAWSALSSRSTPAIPVRGDTRPSPAPPPAPS